MRAAERTTARERRSLRVALTTSASLCPVLLDHRTPNTTSRRRSPGWRSIACADAADGPARTLTTHRRRQGRRRKRRRRSDAERVRPGGRTLLLLSRNADTHHPSTRERPAEAAAASTSSYGALRCDGRVVERARPSERHASVEWVVFFVFGGEEVHFRSAPVMNSTSWPQLPAHTHDVAGPQGPQARASPDGNSSSPTSTTQRGRLGVKSFGFFQYSLKN